MLETKKNKGMHEATNSTTEGCIFCCSSRFRYVPFSPWFGVSLASNFASIRTCSRPLSS